MSISTSDPRKCRKRPEERTHQINSPSTSIHNHKVLGWFEMMDIRQIGTVDSRGLGLRDNSQAISPIDVSGPGAVNKPSRNSCLAHNLATPGVPGSRHCQPNIGRV